MAVRTITAEETGVVQQLVSNARAAMREIDGYDQAAVDRLCQAIAWAGGNEQSAIRLANMSVDESGMGKREPTRRAKVLGILRDALRQKSMGVIDEDTAKGIVKYAKPAGVIASLIPVTSPYVTPVSIAIYAIKCKDAVVFSPHPASRKTTIETVRLMRAALRKQGAPEDLLQCVEKPSIPLANELMASCDLTIATGGPAMVKAAYGSGKPAYGVGAGNATMVIDETANIEEAARNTRISKTNDHGSGCSADGNLLVDSTIYDAFLAQLQQEGGYLVNDQEKSLLRAAYWDAQGRRTPDTIARSAAAVAERAGFPLPPDKTFFIVPERHIGKEHLFSTEKLGVVLSIFKYHGFDMALDMVQRIFETGGKGHSCGIYSFDDDHVHRLALVAPVSRIMVRQVQSSSNAGTFTNGMPMTSSMGCGTWGGNITNENISLKHYMNVTWVSRPIAEDRPSEQELFGEFYNSEIF
ncbi:MAG TPA: aldehyde dehydrogenase family protein [Vicinamibacterales bacterium]|jgi:sulfoacetaldehyde dehydrogenase|nr:aldehyde dehydrogenase family protein [Vicinamibacterales bacterium]